jgi:ATP-dependent HslUV protease subunit HslV
MTTILAVRRDSKSAIGGDGQVTLGSTAIKHQATKIRRVGDNKVLVGFAGSTADAFALLDRFEGMLKKFQGSVQRASIELAKEWRSDRLLRRLEAMMIVLDRENMLVVSGTGDVLSPDDGVAGIGSGGAVAVASARALLKHSKLPPADIVRESLRIASELDVFTNEHLQVEEV